MRITKEVYTHKRHWNVELFVFGWGCEYWVKYDIESKSKAEAVSKAVVFAEKDGVIPRGPYRISLMY